MWKYTICRCPVLQPAFEPTNMEIRSGFVFKKARLSHTPAPLKDLILNALALEFVSSSETMYLQSSFRGLNLIVQTMV